MTCDDCEAALLCVAGTIPGYFKCPSCEKHHVKPMLGTVYRREGPSLALGNRKCKLPFLSDQNMYVAIILICTGCQDRIDQQQQYQAKTFSSGNDLTSYTSATSAYADDDDQPKKKRNFWSRLASRLRGK